MKRLILFLFTLSLAVSTSHSAVKYNEVDDHDKATSTIFIGVLDEDRIYKKNAPGAFADGVIFVAVPNKSGKYNGYDYYALGFKRNVSLSEGPAELPLNPGIYNKAHPLLLFSYSHNWKIRSARSDAFQTREAPELQDGYILPKGTILFFWKSGRGGYEFSLEIKKPIKTGKKIIRAKSIPSSEEMLWFDSSDISEATYTITEEMPVIEKNALPFQSIKKPKIFKAKENGNIRVG